MSFDYFVELDKQSNPQNTEGFTVSLSQTDSRWEKKGSR
jgi:hypothetical protein